MRRYSGRIATVLVVLTVAAVQAPRLAAPGLSAVCYGNDDRENLRALCHYRDGRGFIAPRRLTADLSAVKYSYIATNPLGISGLLCGLVSCGISPEWAFKVPYLLAVALGALGWMLLARRLLGLDGLIVFGVCLVFTIPFMYGKLADAMMWAIAPWYLHALWMALTRVEGRGAALTAAAALSCAAVLIWMGSIYLAAAGACTAILPGPASTLRRRLPAALALAVPAAVVFLVERAWIDAISTVPHADHFVKGFYLFEIPMGHLAFSIVVFTGYLLALAEPIAQAFSLAGGALPGVVLKICAAAALVALTIFALRAKAASGDRKRFAAAAVIHLAWLFMLLLAFSAFFTTNGDEQRYAVPTRGVSQIQEMWRYGNHLAPAMALCWIALAGAGWKRLRDRFQGPGFRRAAVAAALAFWLCIAGTVWLHWAMFSTVDPDRGTTDETTVFIRSEIIEHPDRACRIFDGQGYYAYYDLYPDDPFRVLVTNTYYPQELPRVSNSERRWAYVVVREPVEGAGPAPYLRSPDWYAKAGRTLAHALGLEEVRRFSDGRIRVFAGPVAPFDAGTLKTEAAQTECAEN
jgi:hypothetical protein